MIRWVPRGHRVYDPADPDGRTLACIAWHLGLRLTVRATPLWLGPWRLVDGEWRRPYGDRDTPQWRTLSI
jgi:hypothetical protein